MHYVKHLIDEQGSFEITLKPYRSFEFAGINVQIESINVYCDGYDYPIDVSVKHDLDLESSHALYNNQEYLELISSLTSLPLCFTESGMQNEHENTFETNCLQDLIETL